MAPSSPGSTYLQAELGYRLRQVGRAVDIPNVDHPFVLPATGKPADAFEARGCPYHQAAALADSNDPAALLW